MCLPVTHRPPSRVATIVGFPQKSHPQNANQKQRHVCVGWRARRARYYDSLQARAQRHSEAWTRSPFCLQTRRLADQDEKEIGVAGPALEGPPDQVCGRRATLGL